MLEPITPRSDPRLLVLHLDAPAARYAALDAWEVRALGRLPIGRRAAALGLWRLVARVRPSHVLLVRGAQPRPHGLLRLARELAVRKGFPLAAVDRTESRALALKAPALAELLGTYPELCHLIRGPRDPALVALRVALGALVTHSLPPRRYVPELPVRPAPRVDGRRARPAGATPLRDRSADRRTPRSHDR